MQVQVLSSAPKGSKQLLPFSFAILVFLYRKAHYGAQVVINCNVMACGELAIPRSFVGVIDSGVGGLTVLKGLQEQCPNCNFVYLADSAYCPYGIKSFEEIFERVCALIEFMQSAGACAIVLACNTASVFAKRLRAKFALPIYDVIAPTCEVVSATTVNKRVALLATNATVKSGAYSKILSNCGVTVVSFPCSDFVPFVEQNSVDTRECEQTVQVALRQLPRCNVDTVILGCTHFPVLKNKIAPLVNGAKIVECCTDFSPPSCDNVQTFCVDKKPQKTIYFTTGVAKNANFASKWFGKINFEHIDC